MMASFFDIHYICMQCDYHIRLCCRCHIFKGCYTAFILLRHISCL